MIFSKNVNNLPNGRTYTLLGTSVYIAPEIISQIGYDSTSDLWSIGVILYEMLTG